MNIFVELLHSGVAAADHTDRMPRIGLRWFGGGGTSTGATTMEQYARLLRDVVYDAAERCDDVCNVDNTADKIACLDDAILLLATALADARCLRDTLLECVE